MYLELDVETKPNVIPCSRDDSFWVLIRVRATSQQRESTGQSEHRLPDVCTAQNHPSGTIQNLQIHIQPSTKCRILDILGLQCVDILIAGQSTTLFVRVLRCPPVRLLSEHDEEACDFQTICAELEHMLGYSTTEVLIAEASYTHSLFPQDTILSV